MHLESKNFAQKIGVVFNDPDLLVSAFLHRSYLNEHREIKLSHNERLEFLGDAVLELVVTDFLFNTYPNEDEGDMTAYRAALVNTNSLSEIAKELGMNDYLLLSKGEAKDTGRARQYILANTYESVVGALYLDLGYEAARRFITDTLLAKSAKIISTHKQQDPKSFFQEKAQELFSVTPTYKLIEEVGPDHDKKFTVGLYINDDQIALGTGHSKQEAEAAAARAGLSVKEWAI